MLQILHKAISNLNSVHKQHYSTTFGYLLPIHGTDVFDKFKLETIDLREYL